MTTLTRRRVLHGVGSAIPAAMLAPGISRASTGLPDRPLRLIVGFVAAGGADTVARKLARVLERRTGRYITVENRPGDMGAHPGELVMKGPVDGTMLAMIASNSLAGKLAMRDFPYDPVKDLAPVGIAGTFPLGFAVSPRIGVRTFADYQAWLKEGDDKRRRLGNTSSDAFIDVMSHTVNRAFQGGLSIVKYRGAAPMVNDLAEGRLPAAVTAMTSLLADHRGGRLRLLLTSGQKRMRMAPDVPTAEEVGLPALEMQEFYGFFANKATPPELIDAWNDAIAQALGDRELAAELAQIGLDPQSETPEQTHARLVAHLDDWRRRMKEAGLTPVS